MSEPIIVNYEEDLPCSQWNGDKWRNCPMRDSWDEGEHRMCMECGWMILYDQEQKHNE